MFCYKRLIKNRKHLYCIFLNFIWFGFQIFIIHKLYPICLLEQNLLHLYYFDRNLCESILWPAMLQIRTIFAIISSRNHKSLLVTEKLSGNTNIFILMLMFHIEIALHILHEHVMRRVWSLLIGIQYRTKRHESCSILYAAKKIDEC